MCDIPLVYNFFLESKLSQLRPITTTVREDLSELLDNETKITSLYKEIKEIISN